MQQCACCGELLKNPTDRSYVQTSQNILRIKRYDKTPYYGPEKRYGTYLCHACRVNVEVIVIQFINRKKRKLEEEGEYAEAK